MSIFCHSNSGNVNSILRAFNFLGREVVTFDNLYNLDLKERDLLIISGVGNFDQVMNLYPKKEVIKAADKGVNILGICAGFQCLFRDSEEGVREGYGFFSDSIVKLHQEAKTFYGWNKVYIKIIL